MSKLTAGTRVVLYQDPTTCLLFDRLGVIERLLPFDLETFDAYGRPLLVCAVRIAGEKEPQPRLVSASLNPPPLTLFELLRQRQLSAWDDDCGACLS